MSREAAELYRSVLAGTRALERLEPSVFAEEYRDVASGPSAGEWDNTYAPYLIGVMDAIKEAIDSGRYAVLMKCAQAGGTEAFGINGTCWLLTYYPGPYLYLTNKDETASELSRDRWDHVLRTCEPLKVKHLAGKAHGELIHVKRFTDAKLVLAGAIAPSNYISNPYRGVIFDELDSIRAALPDGRDPVASIEKRMNAWRERGATVLLALAHPTVEEHGAGELYYRYSDRRRAHVECPHCKRWWAPLWKHVKAIPRAGQSPQAAERDPSSYHMVSECCGVELTEADRLLMIQRVRYLSTLPPDIAATKKWIGLHFWAFFMRGFSVREIANEYVAALDSEERMKTFENQTCGDVYRPRAAATVNTVATWLRLAIAEGEAGAYARGEIPQEVQWLTAGQDSREMELHWTVWGWGWVRSLESTLLLNGWLIDWGIEEGPRSAQKQLRGFGSKNMTSQDLMIFDEKLYGQAWPRQGGGEPLFVFQGFHDSGWMHNPVYEYCRAKVGGAGLRPEGGAFPSRGGSVKDQSKAPFVKWFTGLHYFAGKHEVYDKAAKRADLNTFTLKVELTGFTESRFIDAAGVRRARLALPHDVSGEVCAHLASEQLELDKHGQLSWVKHATNHYWDCSVMAYAAAHNSAAFAVRDTRAAQLAAMATAAASSAKAGQRRRRAPSGGDGSSINTDY